MKWNKWIRDLHRLLAVFFTLTVGANFAYMAKGAVPLVVTFSPLFPLFFLFLTGAYMFVLPYAQKWRRPSTPAANTN